MIVTEQTPRHEGMSVEEAGSLLADADVVDQWDTGIKIGTPVIDWQMIQVKFDTLSGTPKFAYLTPDEADHLAQILTRFAEKARSW